MQGSLNLNARVWACWSPVSSCLASSCRILSYGALYLMWRDSYMIQYSDGGLKRDWLRISIHFRQSCHSPAMLVFRKTLKSHVLKFRVSGLTTASGARTCAHRFNSVICCIATLRIIWNLCYLYWIWFERLELTESLTQNFKITDEIVDTELQD